MAVREPILKELLAYKKAVSEAEKEAHRAKLRHLFERIDTNAAQPFEVMLSSPNALAVTFRDVLHNDSLQNELIGILAKKYMPAQCIPTAPARPAPLSGVTLRGVTLTDEASFNAFHVGLKQRITVLEEACKGIDRFNLKDAKKQLLAVVGVLSNRLARAQMLKIAAFQQTDATKKAEGVKRAGDAYTGVFVLSQLWQLYINIAVATDAADAAGVPSGILAKRLVYFEKDEAILALTQAGLDANVPAMHSALPAARSAFALHVESLDTWIASIHRGEFLSKKVIAVADMTMIAISIYQVWKLPAVSGGSTTPPTILGTLPGGAALGSVVNLPSLARALEAIRNLVAIGALDGALIAGIGSLGGGPSIALPELQRPTSLSVQTPGSGPKAGAPAHTSQAVGVPAAGVVSGITKGSQVTEETIRKAMMGAPMHSQQSGGVSLRMVQQYVDKLLAGEVAPAIKVDGHIIVDGNHRYIAARILGREPAIQPWPGGRGPVVSWEQIKISTEW
ncbi:MAG: hypothetical protein HUU21_37435 [Polyangiaceae bacterium]|nr:hypothetical protein [Polyangiaceae bacterium]